MEDELKGLTEGDSQLLRRVQSAGDEMAVALVLAVARERLGMDVAFVSTIDSKQQTVHALMGDPTPLGAITATAFPVGETYCRKMLDGALPNVVPDTSAEAAIRELAATERIGAYVGVPVTFSDGSVQGTLCSISSAPRPNLGEAEGSFMKALAAIVATRLERNQDSAGRTSGLAPPSG